MRKFSLMAVILLALGCTKTMNPLQSAGCDVETAITGAFGAVIVNQCAGTDAIACGNALQTALGNVNACAAPIPAPAQALGAFAVKANWIDYSKWKTIGDIKKGDLDAAKQAQSQSLKAQGVVTTQGVVGAIICPMALNTITGLLTGVVPKECGCTKNLDAGALGSALVAACVAAVPI